MKKIKIPFSETNRFSPLIDDYFNGKPELKAFYKYTPAIEAFADVIKARENTDNNRETLVKAVLNQYRELHSDQSSPVIRAIHSLSEAKTFTVTTGHQLNIFTGPLYSIYKIATTIRLAEELKQNYPSNNFVPVFWMASEDHDFDEINHTRIYSKTLTWETKQTGAVGRMKPEGMMEVVAELKTIIGKEHELLDLMESAYRHSDTMADATRKIVHSLFESYGLVVMDGDDAELKSLFAGEMKEELLHGKSFTAVEHTNSQLEKLYKIQVQPREINLFYLTDEIRERIVKTETGEYEVLNTSLRFSETELLNQLAEHPERFSPNVVMRPIYQEKILPNLAYIGGPGELNYWFQFKGAFEVYGIPFPVVMLRNCMMLIDQTSADKLGKLGIDATELFHSTDALILKVLEDSTEFHPGTEKQMAAVQKTYTELAEQFSKLDASLVPSIEAEKQKVLNGLKNIEEKGRRSLKRKNETVLNQVKNLKEKLFPENGLQERIDNFIPYYINSSTSFIQMIVDNTEPFANKFLVLIDEK